MPHHPREHHPHRPKHPEHHGHSRMQGHEGLSGREPGHEAVKAEQELMEKVYKIAGLKPETADDGARGRHTEHEEQRIHDLAEKLRLGGVKPGDSPRDEVLFASAQAAMLLAEPDKLAALRDGGLVNPPVSTLASARKPNQHNHS